MMITKNSNNLLQSVQNGLKILRLFSMEKPIWGVTDIAKKLNINKSTVSRIVSDLVKEGFLESQGSKYCLGLSLLYLSGVISTHLEIQREARETLEQLVKKLDETAHIAILEDKFVTYLQKIECKHPIRLLSHIGKNNPASCTSSGKVILAHQKRKIIEEIVHAGLPKMGPNSIVEPEQFYEDLNQVKKDGYSVCIDEMHEGVVSIAAPIRDYTTDVVAAVSIVGPKERINKENLTYYIEEIVGAAEEISVNLGYIDSLDEGRKTYEVSKFK